jgi:CheY-like chemotaxis protein
MEYGKAGGSASSVERLQEQLRELEAENRLLRQVCSASTMPLPLPNRQVRWPLEVSLDVAAAWHSSLPRDVPLHVLVVDGDTERRRSARALAQQANAQADSVLSLVVSEAASPDEALGQLDSNAGSCDLILLDAALLDTESNADQLRFARFRRLARDHVPIVVVCEGAAGVAAFGHRRVADSAARRRPPRERVAALRAPRRPLFCAPRRRAAARVRHAQLWCAHLVACDEPISHPHRRDRFRPAAELTRRPRGELLCWCGRRSRLLQQPR